MTDRRERGSGLVLSLLDVCQVERESTSARVREGASYRRLSARSNDRICRVADFIGVECDAVRGKQPPLLLHDIRPARRVNGEDGNAARARQTVPYLRSELSLGVR